MVCSVCESNGHQPVNNTKNNPPFPFQRSYNIGLNVVLVSQPHILSDTAVGKIGRFCLFFFAKFIFYICRKPAKFIWCGLEGFYPLKIAVKVTLGVFQNLLSNSVNSKQLFLWCERAGSSNGPSRLTELLSKFLPPHIGGRHPILYFQHPENTKL